MQQLLPQEITGQQVGVNRTFFQGFFLFLSLNPDKKKKKKGETNGTSTHEW